MNPITIEIKSTLASHIVFVDFKVIPMFPQARGFQLEIAQSNLIKICQELSYYNAEFRHWIWSVKKL